MILINQVAAAIKHFTCWNSFLTDIRWDIFDLICSDKNVPWKEKSYEKKTRIHTERETVTINFCSHLHISEPFFFLSLSILFPMVLFVAGISTRFIRHFNKTDNMQNIYSSITSTRWLNIFRYFWKDVFYHRLHC